MIIFHTADWHLGQILHGYERAYEQQAFLDWLLIALQEHQVDVLLIAGDIFDVANPAAATIKMFYRFLNAATTALPNLQIIITAGNHDSASRLETPLPLLASSNVHITGFVHKTQEGNIDYQQLTIPLKNKEGKIAAWCLSIPFLRIGDYPVLPSAENTYAAGVAAVYKEAVAYAMALQTNEQAIVAMGHLHVQQAEVTSLDSNERQIIGGVDGISVAAFPNELSYLALGHIHKAQKLGGKNHIRYSGSPIPLSFSEKHYQHQILKITIDNSALIDVQSIEVPVVVPLLSIPYTHQPIEEVLPLLQALPLAIADEAHLAPYLEVRVRLNQPEPALRAKIEAAIEGKHVRLLTIKTTYASVTNTHNQTENTFVELQSLNPQDIFEQQYKTQYQSTVPESMMRLFKQSLDEVLQSDKDQ